MPGRYQSLADDDDDDEMSEAGLPRFDEVQNQRSVRNEPAADDGTRGGGMTDDLANTEQGRGDDARIRRGQLGALQQVTSFTTLGCAGCSSNNTLDPTTWAIRAGAKRQSVPGT